MTSSTPRVQLAPLTTTFIPPPDCTAYAAINNNASQNVFYGAQSCQQGQPKDWSTCWPSASIKTQSNPLAGFGFYSPGTICPSGFVSACTQVAPASGALSTAILNASFSFQYAPTAGETAVGCCPSGFTCTRVDGYSWQTCRQDATSGFISVGLCGSSGSTFEQVTRVSLGPSTSLVYGPLFQLMYQSTDVPRTSSTAGAKSSNSLQMGSSSPTISAATANSASESPTASTASSSDISAGAKIGIGIGVPLVVILLVALGTILFLRRRRAKAAALAVPRTPRVEAPNLTNEKPMLNRHEVSGGQWTIELGSHTPRTAHELPTEAGTGTR